ncbi:MAG: hypothetical protein ACLP1X_05215, partial [Polyangiaceae bacterium]
PARDMLSTPVMITLSHLHRAVAWLVPTLVFAPFLMGADGQGCGPGAPFGSSTDAGVPVTDAVSGGGCTPADCGNPPPELPCPSNATSTSSCVARAEGGCGWSTPECVPVDAGPADGCTGIALPCVGCPYGSLGTAKDGNGCDTCPICAPPPDGAVVCGCPAILVGKCPDGSSPPTTTGPAPCYCEESGPCPAADAGAADAGPACTSNADCPTGSECGFLEADGCTAKGECFATPGVTCDAFELGCACDGSEMNLACNGLPTGYSPEPYRHTGACTDGG